MRRFSTLMFRAALFVAIVWFIGQVVSDRWFWSQWLLWIPTFIVLLILFIVALILAQSRRKYESAIIAVVFLVLACYFLFNENNVFSTNNAKGELKIAAWTMSHSKQKVAEESAELIVQLDPDIMLLTHGWHVRGEPSIKNWLSDDGKKLISGPFTLLTTVRPIEVRTLVASDGIYISFFKLDTRNQLGRELVVYAVDLPFNLLESRASIVRRAQRLLSKTDAEEPHVVIGDFNMTRNSNSMKRLFPAMTDAWDSGGMGWSSSYHRAFPLFHIDHILVGEDIHALSYELVDPQFGRHCIQLLQLTQ